MRARPPVTRVVDRHLVVRTEVEADGEELPPIEVTVPVDRADLLDPTATPALPVLATLAAARGDDLVVDADVDDDALGRARRLAALLSGWWGTPTPSVEAAGRAAAAPHGEGVGVFFSRGVDSWSTVLDLLDAPPGERVTHLVTVHHNDRVRSVEAAIVAGHARAAQELGLGLVVVSTTARRGLDPVRPWLDVAGPVLASAGLTVAAGLTRLVLSGMHRDGTVDRTGTDPEVVRLLGTGAVDVDLGNPDRDRHERVAHVLGDPRARGSLQVCWEGRSAGNCGRCQKCQLTLAALLMAGDPDPARGFDHGPDAALVRPMAVDAARAPMAAALVAGLAPAHEELRRAWADALARGAGDPVGARLGDHAVPGLAGPGAPERVAAALRAGTGQADAPPAPPLGWRSGATPLRPALADHPRVRAEVATNPERPVPWAVVESQVRDGDRDGQQARLALLLQDALGPGVCYLPNLLWEPDGPPGLEPDAVGRLLRSARVRLWWRADGDLDALRVVEAVEHGCLPLQVMPAGPAADLRADVPPALAGLVLDEQDVPALDAAPGTVAARLGPVVEHLLGGHPERDLVQASYRA